MAKHKLENNKEKVQHDQLGSDLANPNTDSLFSTITEFAANLCETPIASINFIASDQLRKSGDAKQSTGSIFCDLTIEVGELFEVCDARKDDRFSSISKVVNNEIVFYAGIPLFNDEGVALGTLCLTDTKPKKLTNTQKKGLQLFANQVANIVNMKETKIRYETLIESSRDMIYELDESGKFLFANKSTLTKTGYSLEELRAITCWDLIQEETREEVKSYYVNQIKDGKSSIYHEFPIEDRNGKTIWLGQSVDYIFDNGRVSKAYVIAKDVTELVRTRLMLKESEEQILAEKNILNMMVFSSPAAIAMFSKDLKYLAYSEKWDINREINEQIIGLDSTKNSDGDHELLDSIKEKILRGETVGKENDLVISPEGEKRWIKWVATPWSNTTDGSVGGVIIYTDDVTHIINHEAELEKARKEAVKSSKIKEDFLSSMSHEIRTPLNAIIGTANLLIDENKELAQDEKFKLLKFSSNNLLALINNVLDFSKIESGNIHLDEGDFEIRTLTDSLVNSWKPLANQKGIDLILKCDERIPEVVKGDSVRLGQILNNLVNNAIKFTEDGFVQVKIDMDQLDSNNIHFEIHDTGIGIPQAKQKDVFESFKQVKSHLTEQAGGTGLGLPICRQLVKMMGSELELKSKEGFGSKFSFTLRLEKGEQSNLTELVESSNKQQLDVQVLLVEDNPANQFIARSFLKKWGITPKVASNGLEALEYIKTKEFDIVLLDIRMPVMDGYTCAKKIREMKGAYFQNIPIIALTASTILDVRKKGSLLEFDDFLSKPFEPKKLYCMLLKYADRMVEIDKMNFEESEELTCSYDATVNSRIRVEKNLQSYTEGDPDFLIEFSENIINNLLQLKSGIPKFLMLRDIEGLREVVHMTKPTIEILGQNSLLDSLNDLVSDWKRERINEDLLGKTFELIDENLEILNNILKSSKSEELLEA